MKPMPKVMLHNKYQPIKESWSTKVFHFSPSIILSLIHISELLFFTNHAQVYKSRASEFADTKASVLGDYVASKLEMEAVSYTHLDVYKRQGWYYAEGSISEMYYKALGKRYGFTLYTPIKEMSKEAVHAILYGTCLLYTSIHSHYTAGLASMPFRMDMEARPAV